MRYFVEGRIINQSLTNPGESDYKTIVYADSAAEAEKMVQEALVDAGCVITSLSASKAINSFDRDEDVEEVEEEAYTINDDTGVLFRTDSPIKYSEVGEQVVTDILVELVTERAMIEVRSMPGLFALIKYIARYTPLDLGGEVDDFIMRITDRYHCELTDPESRTYTEPGFYLMCDKGRLKWAFKYEIQCTDKEIYKLTAERKARTAYDYIFKAWCYDEEAK